MFTAITYLVGAWLYHATFGTVRFKSCELRFLAAALWPLFATIELAAFAWMREYVERHKEKPDVDHPPA